MTISPHRCLAALGTRTALSVRFGQYALGLLLLTSCATRPSEQGMLLERLYFGLSTPHGTISAQDFDQFVQDTVTVRFPEGLTELHAQGQWRDARSRIIAEASMVIEIAMPDTAENHDRIAAITAAYKKRFSQESVMLVEESARVSF